MSNPYSYILLMAIFLCMACEQTPQEGSKEVFAPRLAALAVENLETSIQWYTQNLGFETEKEIESYPDYQLRLAFLKLGSFRLELIEFANVYKPSEVLSDPDSHVGGVIKMGWIVKDIQDFYHTLKEREEVKIVAELGELPPNSLPIKWPSSYFLIEDPDGNYLQFFDSGLSQTPAPWLFMIAVDSLEEAISWYSQNLGFTEYLTVGEEGNKRTILERNHCVLELYEPSSVRKAEDISADSSVLGVNKIAFGVTDLTPLDSLFAGNEVEIAVPLAETEDIDWASRGMIVLDAEGNWTQIFELTR